MGEIATLDIRIDSAEAKQGVQDLGGLTAAAEKTEAAVSAFEQEFQKLAAEMQQTNALLQEQMKYQQAFAEQMRASGSATADLGKQFEGVESAIAKQASRLDQLGAGMRRAAPAATEVAHQTQVAAKELETFAVATEHAESGSAGMARELLKMTAEIASVGAVAEALKSAAEASLKFTTAMADIHTITSEGADIEKMSQQVQQLAIAFGKSPVDEAHGLYQVISAGVSDSTKQMELLNAANTLTVDGMTDQKTAVDAVTTLWATYGQQVGSVSKLTDEMFATVAGGKLRMGDLATSIGQVASIASQAGVDLPSLFASIDALTNSGLSAQRAIEGMRQVLSSVSKPSDQAAKLAQQLGIDFSLAGLQAKGLAGFMQELQQKTHGNQSELAMLAGSVEAWAAIAPLGGTGAEQFATALDKIHDSAGEAQRALRIMQESPEFQLNQLKAQVEVLKTNVGGELVSAVLPGIQALNANFGTLTETLKVATEAAVAFFAMRGAAAIADRVGALLAEQAALRVSQEATVEAALATAGYTRAEGESAAAAIEAAQADVAVRIAKLEEVQANSLLTASLGSTVAARNAEALSAARAAEAELGAAAAASEASIGSRALGGAVGLLGGPIGIATGVLIGGVAALNHWSDAADRALQETVKSSQGIADRISQEGRLSEDLRTQQAILDDSTASVAAHNAAAEQLKRDKDALIALDPSFQQTFQNTKSGADDAAKALADMQSKLADLKKTQAELEQQRDKPTLTGFQKFEDFFSGLGAASIHGGAGVGAQLQQALAENQRAQLERNSAAAAKALAAQEAAVKQAQAAVQAAKDQADGYDLLDKSLGAFTTALGKAGDAQRTLTAAEQRQAEQNANYLARLDSESQAQELNWVALQRSSEAYQKLTASQKQEADILLALIQMHRDQADVLAAGAKAIERIQNFRSISDVHAEAVAKQKKQIDETKAATVDLVKYLDQTNEAFRTIHEAGSTLASDLTNGFVAMAMGTKDAFSRMTQAILADIARLAAQKAFEQLLNVGLNALAADFVAGAGGGGENLQLPSDVGGPSGFEPLAPVIPQGSALRAPVVAGGMSTQSSVIVNVHNDGSVTSEAGGQDQAQQSLKLAKLIEAAAKRVVQNETRPGGTIYNLRGGRG